MSESKGAVACLRGHPSHPGRHVYHACMEGPLGEHILTVSEAAYRIGVSRVTVLRAST